MKAQILKLDDFENKPINIVATVKLKHRMADHEFFFHFNNLCSFNFSRSKDLCIKGSYYDFFFTVFQAINPETNTKYIFFKNKCDFSIQKKEILELFIDEQNVKFLLENDQLDYIFYCNEEIPDFSLILSTEKINSIISFDYQEINEELLQTILYYE